MPAALGREAGAGGRGAGAQHQLTCTMGQPSSQEQRVGPGAAGEHLPVQLVQLEVQQRSRGACREQSLEQPSRATLLQQQDILEERQLQQQGEKWHFSLVQSVQLDVRSKQVCKASLNLHRPEITGREILKAAMGKQDTLEWLEAHGPRKHLVGAAGRRVLPAPVDKPGALTQVEEEEDDSDQELSQEDDISSYNIGVKPLSPELFQDPHTGSQERPSPPSTEPAGEESGDQQSPPSNSVWIIEAEPGASALARALEEQEHQVPVAPVVQEEDKGPSPVFNEQDTAAEAESEEPALRSSSHNHLSLLDSVLQSISDDNLSLPDTAAEEKQDEPALQSISDDDLALLDMVLQSISADDLALLDTDQVPVGKVPGEAVVVTQGCGQQNTAAEQHKEHAWQNPSDDDLALLDMVLQSISADDPALLDTDQVPVGKVPGEAVVVSHGPSQQNTAAEEHKKRAWKSTSNDDLSLLDMVLQSISDDDLALLDTATEEKQQEPALQSSTDDELALLGSHQLPVGEVPGRVTCSQPPKGLPGLQQRHQWDILARRLAQRDTVRRLSLPLVHRPSGASRGELGRASRERSWVGPSEPTPTASATAGQRTAWHRLREAIVRVFSGHRGPGRQPVPQQEVAKSTLPHKCQQCPACRDNGEDDCGDDSDQEEAEWDSSSICTIWASPSAKKSPQHPHAVSEELPSPPSRSSSSTKSAGEEEDGDEQSTSSDSAWSRDAELGASAPARALGALEEERHHMPLVLTLRAITSLAAQEDAAAPSSPPSPRAAPGTAPPAPAAQQQAAACPLPAQALARRSPSPAAIAVLPRAPSRQHRPSLFRRVLRALGRAFHSSRGARQHQQHRSAAPARARWGGCWP